MNMIARYCCCLLLLQVLAVITVSAQPKCKIEHYSTEDGLSHDIITCIFKDREGFMWFGTWNGINRFDGQRFVTYKSSPGDQSYLKNNRIDQIVDDDFLQLWIQAYDGQVYRFNKRTEKWLPLPAIIKLPPRNKYEFRRILSTSHGNIWIETLNEGLLLVTTPQADSSGYYTYQEGRSKDFNLPSNQILFFNEDKKGRIWIGTQKGLARLEKDKNGIYKNTAGAAQFPKDIAYTCMEPTLNGILYFGMGNGGLFQYVNDTTHAIWMLSNSAIHSLQCNRALTNMYATTAGGELIDMHFVHMPYFKTNRLINDPTNPLYSIYEDHTGNLWVEPENEGVIRLDPTTGKMKTFRQKNNSKNNNFVRNHYTVFEDNQNRVWVNVKDGGFGYYDPGANNVEYFYNEPGAPNRQFSNIVYSWYYDPAGLLWLRTDERGIEKITFQRNPFDQRLLVDPGTYQSDNEVRGLLEDRKKRLWVGTKAGKLYIFENGQRVNLQFENIPASGIGLVYTIMQDRAGNIWLGTKAHGVYKAVPINKEETKYRLNHYMADPNDPNSIGSNEIYSLVEDKAGNIWIGSFDDGLTLAIPDGDRINFVHDRNALSDYPAKAFRKIRHMTLDKQDNLWLGTTDGLLIVNTHAPNKFTYAMYQKIPGDPYSLGNNDIQYVYRDSRNTMWIATSGGGLNQAMGDNPLKGLRFQVYTTQHGLPNDYLLSCAEDPDHHLWIATQTGLSRFDINKKVFRNYNSYDGVPKYAFSEASGLVRLDGQIAFGTLNGLLTFDPRSIVNHPIPAQLAFTNLQINNTNIVAGGKDKLLPFSVNHTTELTLKHNQNIISIDYVVLDYRSSDKQSYAYRLQGFDTGWHYNRSERRATYTNLPPGDYVFEVKCTNPELYSNEPVKSMHITILPPWWKTWWAYLIYVLIAAIIFEIVRRAALTMLRLRQRIAVEKKLAELKLNFFTNVSHELRTPLTLILSPIEEIGRQEKLTTQGRQYIEVVKKNANRMARFVNQLLDLRKLQSGKASLHPAKVEVISFVKSIGEYFLELAKEKRINFQVVSESREIEAWLDLDKIETVIYNLVANAFKFTPEGKAIRIHVAQLAEHNKIQIEVSDQGTGVPPHLLDQIFELFYEEPVTNGKPVKGTGIGLALSKEMIALHGGTITARNNDEGGLTVTVTLQVGRDSTKKATPEFLAHDEASDMLAGYQQEPAAPAELAPTTADGSLPLLLVVEDNADLQAFLKSQLTQLYRVEIAENGEEGLAKALELQPDLVLSDIMMPKMDGIQLLDQLKNNLITSHIPVILLTAKSAVESQIEALDYGADYYITKPFRHDFLVAAIRNLINQRKKVLASLLEGKKTVELEPGEVTITSRDEAFLQQIVAIVEEKMADVDFNIDTVAETIAMGRTTFYRKFKGLTGLAPVEFVREMRLKRAKQYLDSGYGNISEIAYSAGFNNAKYFSTCFKGRFGVTPSEYVKQKDKERH
jgi:signal transduction histidine kinase/ligand-binding sensor domain-containing protein/DNA-binding response OmpR family regulator